MPTGLNSLALSPRPTPFQRLTRPKKAQPCPVGISLPGAEQFSWLGTFPGIGACPLRQTAKSDTSFYLFRLRQLVNWRLFKSTLVVENYNCYSEKTRTRGKAR